MRSFTLLFSVSFILIPVECYTLQNAENNNNRKATEGYRHLIYPGRRANKTNVLNDRSSEKRIKRDKNIGSIIQESAADLSSLNDKRNVFSAKRSAKRYGSIDDDEDEFPRDYEDDIGEREDDNVGSSSDDKTRDLEELNDAKRQMLDEIQNIRKVLRKKIEMYFRSVYPRFRKEDMCFGNMANGVNFNSVNYFTHEWRKIIKGALSMAGKVVKTALGPFAGPSKAALKGLARLSDYVGNKKERIEDYLPPISPTPMLEVSTGNEWEKIVGPAGKHGPNQGYIEPNSKRQYFQNKKGRRTYLQVPDRGYMETRQQKRAYMQVPHRQYIRNVKHGPPNGAYIKGMNRQSFNDGPQNKAFIKGMNKQLIKKGPRNRVFVKQPNRQFYKNGPQNRAFKKVPKRKLNKKGPRNGVYVEVPRRKFKKKGPGNEIYVEVPNRHFIKKGLRKRAFVKGTNQQFFETRSQGRPYVKTPKRKFIEKGPQRRANLKGKNRQFYKNGAQSRAFVKGPNRQFYKKQQQKRAYVKLPKGKIIKKRPRRQFLSKKVFKIRQGKRGNLKKRKHVKNLKYSGKAQKMRRHKTHTIQLDIRHIPYFYSNSLFSYEDDYYTHQIFERFIQEFCDEDEKKLS